MEKKPTEILEVEHHIIQTVVGIRNRSGRVSITGS